MLWMSKFTWEEGVKIMLHEPASKVGKEYASAYKTRIGVWMFFLYAAIYVGFVAINLLMPDQMEKVVMAGLNLAVVYGFGLIVFALVLALIYNHMCTTRESRMRREDTTKGAGR